ncbi:50S ribosomal protein L16 3-hydroxylase [Nitrosomonas cryotolerans]|uniref:50S ribosomal protein L16 3-hydroxylase n=1 Tax=Nitrosomonas cryotolerans ATCC 49181 TaxID=1131553 RepID=A0A1N6H8F7_9PROT|nr:cupin domain-containing protein [Nitrosomonas cryotolerans]SFP79923.1 50S ribosomal protein L16 3-hydroxylase [Nitrosomonas cryotolerans]SIO16118.1 50S ribosomal protein L16 3-hydroxylase [Nitrosomonas cryotolerans ATCC 49181]
MKTIILGDLTPRDFLRDYWQKKPLLVRNALAEFEGLLTRDELINLACQEDAQSRLVIRKNEKWSIKQGPFTIRDFSGLQKKQWTLLVNDVNHFFHSARDLLLKFNFIPHARLDDLMISYAPRGGGIGPHLDSYDVFLLQGLGRRRWQISAQQDDSLIADAPLKILSNFCPEQEWTLESGDMLYLPPNYAHHGVAENDCMTYSIGFRAPSHHDLITQFLIYLQDHMEIDGWYEDPGMQLQSHPARISQAMLRQTRGILSKIKWHHVDIENFLGIYLTEPKAHIFFKQPSCPLVREVFIQRVKEMGVQLDLKSRMLISGNNLLFLNGEAYPIDSDAYPLLEKLADRQILPPCDTLDSAVIHILYEWYLYGYITINEATN